MFALAVTGLLLLVLVILFVRYMTANHGVFREMGIEHPPTSWFFGNFHQAIKYGMFEVQKVFYNKYKDKKVYGWYDSRRPTIIVKDLDMIKDIYVKHFNCFSDRHMLFDVDPPFSLNLLHLKGDHWKRVRSIVSPTFSSGRIKRMTPHIERNTRTLLENLRHIQETGEEVELREISSCFTLDVIASTGFGLEINTLKDPKNEFATQAKKSIHPNPILFIMLHFLPAAFGALFSKLGFSFVPKKTLQYFTKAVDSIIESRKQEGLSGKVNDFLDLVTEAETDDVLSAGKLTREEIQRKSLSQWKTKNCNYSNQEWAQAMLFIIAGFETTASGLSFILFYLAMNPECCAKAQAEVDAKCGKDFPDYDKVQKLTYLDMCINEAIRIKPPAFLINRTCTEALNIQGVHFPKDMIVTIPVYALHTDPELFPEPEKFDPERFNPENKSKRHPYAHLPFGHGPRSCIGMRLALLELKMVIAAILQKFTPVPCSKSVYPVRLGKIEMKALDGLWVQFDIRK